jgi:hypothetical protein
MQAAREQPSRLQCQSLVYQLALFLNYDTDGSVPNGTGGNFFLFAGHNPFNNYPILYLIYPPFGC